LWNELKVNNTLDTVESDDRHVSFLGSRGCKLFSICFHDRGESTVFHLPTFTQNLMLFHCSKNQSLIFGTRQRNTHGISAQLPHNWH
jgi:hypothetical protein